MRGQPRKPATKFAHLRKKMDKNQLTKGMISIPKQNQVVRKSKSGPAK